MSASQIRILSVGSTLPGPAVDNAALARRFGMDALWEQWVDHFVGTRTRHLAIDLESGKPRHSLAELGASAARTALADAELSPADVDVVILATANPDRLMPATVNMVADTLGIDGVPTFQLQSGCAGAFQALQVAGSLLAGGLDTALVITGEVCAKHFDVTADLRSLPPAELVNAVLFGDAAAAAVLTRDAVGGLAVRHLVNRLCGLGREPGQVVEWFGMADRDAAVSAVREDYKEIEVLVPKMTVETFDELLEGAGWSAEDVDFVLPPQLSGVMTARVRDLLPVPNAVEISCVTETGNTGNALPFLQLERALREMAPGDRAVGVAIESSKWIKGGLAVERV